MGSADSRLLKLTEFRRLTDNPEDENEIPLRPELRHETDKKFKYAFLGFLLFFIVCLSYVFYFSDIRRLCGYDSCGNLCGYENYKYDEWECTGKDFRTKPYLEWYNTDSLNYLITPKKCVSKCDPKSIAIFDTCVEIGENSYSDSIDFEQVLMQLRKGLVEKTGQIILGLVISTAFCGVMLLVFRYAIAWFVWGSLVGALLLMIMCTCYLWAFFGNNSYDSNNNYRLQALTITATIFTLIFLVLFLVMIKRIKLVISLFKEAAKAFFCMPHIILMSVLFALIHMCNIALFLYIDAVISTSGILKMVVPDYLEYIPNGFMYFTYWLNIFVLIWIMQIISGIEYMIVAGTLSKWFFTSNKQSLHRPIRTSAYVVLTYHLGTVIIGSLLIAIMVTIRTLIRFVTRYRCYSLPCGMDRLLKIGTKNAYVITAMHGQGFWNSGKRASHLILTNIVNIFGINCISDFVISMATFFIILLSSLVVIYVQQEGIAVPFVILYSWILGGTIFRTFGTAVDTMYICFCEDMLMNDGISKPYAMPKGLMEFIENSKKVVGENRYVVT